MKKFYYVQTGHRIGLDRFRRALAILNILQDDEIVLLCSDYRIAHEARNFGVKESVGIDVVKNIVNIAHHGDKIIFDSSEANPIMLEDMRSYFSTFIRVSSDPLDRCAKNEFLISNYFQNELTCKCTIIDDKYFQKHNKTINIGFFFGDDDYEKDLLKYVDLLKELNIVFMSGYYYFLDYEDELKQNFKQNYDFLDYDEFILSCNILITSSPQAVLQSLASGGKPIYFQRQDYNTNYIELFNTLNIPIIQDYNFKQLRDIVKKIDNHRYTYKTIQSNSNKLKKYLTTTSGFYQV